MLFTGYITSNRLRLIFSNKYKLLKFYLNIQSATDDYLDI